MAQVIDLPAGLHLRHAQFSLSGASSTPGPGLDGRTQVLFSENRVWMASLVFPPLSERAARLATVVGDMLRGRVNVLRVPVSNRGLATFHGDLAAFYEARGYSPQEIAQGYVPFGDGVEFDDGTGFALADPADPVAFEAVAAGAVQISLRNDQGGSLGPGDYFSIRDFLYRVESNDAGKVRFNPPLRQDVAAGEAVQVNAPRVALRLRDDDGWRVFQDFGRQSREMHVAMVEAFERD